MMFIWQTQYEYQRIWYEHIYLHEHKKDENSSLYNHSFLTDHIIDYCKPEILMHLEYVLKKASKSRTTVLINP